MAVTAQRLEILVNADVNQAVRALGQVDQASQKTATSINKSGASMQQAGQSINQAGALATVAGGRFSAFGSGVATTAAKMATITPIALAAGGGLVALATKSVQAASNMQEAANKSSVVFGQSSSAIASFASTASTQLGLSETAALSATATFGNLFSSMQVGQQQAASLSVDIVKLAGDLSSFHNVDIQQALADLQSGLVGESEPMRKFGVLLNETAVQAQALAMGLGGAKGELTEADKVMARYALIMQQTTTAQGDFARTSDGLANSTRIVRANIDNAVASIGQKMLPAIQDASNDLVAFTSSPRFDQLAESIGNAASGTVDLASGFANLVIEADKVNGALGGDGWQMLLAGGLGAKFFGPAGAIAGVGLSQAVSDLKEANKEITALNIGLEILGAPGSPRWDRNIIGNVLSTSDDELATFRDVHPNTDRDAMLAEEDAMTKSILNSRNQMADAAEEEARVRSETLARERDIAEFQQMPGGNNTLLAGQQQLNALLAEENALVNSTLSVRQQEFDLITRNWDRMQGGIDLNISQSSEAIGAWQQKMSEAERAKDMLLKKKESQGGFLSPEDLKSLETLDWYIGRVSSGIENDLNPGFIQSQVNAANFTQSLDDLNQAVKDQVIDQQQYQQIIRDATAAVDPTLQITDPGRFANQVAENIDAALQTIKDGITPVEVPVTPKIDTESASAQLAGMPPILVPAQPQFIPGDEVTGTIDPITVPVTPEFIAGDEVTGAISQDDFPPIVQNVIPATDQWDLAAEFIRNETFDPKTVTVDGNPDPYDEAARPVRDEQFDPKSVLITGENADAMGAINEVLSGLNSIPLSITVTAYLNSTPALDTLQNLRNELPSSPAKTGPFKTLPNWDAVFEGIATSSKARTEEASGYLDEFGRWMPHSPAQAGPFSKMPNWDFVFGGISDSVRESTKDAEDSMAAFDEAMRQYDPWDFMVGDLASIVSGDVGRDLEASLKQLQNQLAAALELGAPEAVIAGLESAIAQTQGRLDDVASVMSTDAARAMAEALRSDDQQQMLSDALSDTWTRAFSDMDAFRSGQLLHDLQEQYREAMDRLNLAQSLGDLIPSDVLSGLADDAAKAEQAVLAVARAYQELGLVAKDVAAEQEMVDMWKDMLGSIEDLTSGDGIKALEDSVADLQQQIAVATVAGLPQAVIDSLQKDLTAAMDELSRGQIIADAAKSLGVGVVVPLSAELAAAIGEAIGSGNLGDQFVESVIDAVDAGRLDIEQALGILKTASSDTLLDMQADLRGQLIDAILSGKDTDELRRRLETIDEIIAQHGPGSNRSAYEQALKDQHIGELWGDDYVQSLLDAGQQDAGRMTDEAFQKILDALDTGKIGEPLEIGPITLNDRDFWGPWEKISKGLGALPPDFTITAHVNIEPALESLALLDEHLPHSPAKRGPLSKAPNWDYLFGGVSDSAERHTNRAMREIAGLMAERGGSTGAGSGSGELSLVTNVTVPLDGEPIYRNTTKRIRKSYGSGPALWGRR